MEHSIGKKIAFYRKARGMTQEELAEVLGVSPQAVSKWENDIACPDIALIAPIAKYFGVSTDELLSAEPVQTVKLTPVDQRKSLDELMMHITVNAKGGDKVRINLPMRLVKLAIEIGLSIPQINGNSALESIDLEQILSLVEKGVVGKLVEVETSTGDHVEIVVE